MARDGGRARRIGEQIHRDLAELLRSEVKDPRVALVTVLDVQVARDLSHAKVYVSVLDPAQPVEPALEALRAMAGWLRGLVGQRLRTRVVPALHFVRDESIERGAQLSRLINDAVASDRRKAGPGDEDPQ